MSEKNWAGEPKDTRTMYPKMMQSGPFTVEASGYEKVKGETIPRRHPQAKDKLVTTPADDVKTIFDILKRSANAYGNAKCLGHRKVLNTHEETKKIKKIVDGKPVEEDKKWTYFELSGYTFKSFVEYEQLVLQLGSGLAKLGLKKGDVVQLYGATSGNWLSMSHGSVSQSLTIATAYDTLGEEGLKHSLQQTEAKAIFADAVLLKSLANPLKDARDIKYVIHNEGDVDQAQIDKIKGANDAITVLSYEDLRKLGEENPVEPVPPSPEDICCIMYTSGSTGTPKGVPLKHSAVLAAIAGVTTIIGKYIGPGDKLLTYLPQAHILEFVFENACIFWGGTMGYGNPKTLSDTSVRNCKGDIREFCPTILVGVPQVWETVKKGIIGKVNAGSPIIRNMFWGALAAKSALMSTGLPGAGILDAVVFKKIKDATGGQLRICMSGGGPLAKETQRFISMAISPMISGYGLTETTAMGALMDPLHWTDSALGDIPASIEIKLVDYAEAGYTTDTAPPQGEIWIRGSPVTDGYFKNDAETKEAITSDGWFKTGDIGEFDKVGHLKIIDRKKNLVKNLHGEYIALEKLESVYRSAPITQNICVYAAEDKTKPIAIIVPAEPALKKLAQEHSIEGQGIDDLVHDKKLNKIVLAELQAVGKKAGLKGIEIIDGVALSAEEWTPANGLVTAAQKVNRRAILSKFKKEVDAAYGSQ